MTETQTAAAIAELVGSGPLEVARQRAELFGVRFGVDVRVRTPHMHDRALFLVRCDGATIFARSQELEALHSARVLAEHGHRVLVEVVAAF